MQTRIHIGGRWQEARDGSKLPVSDPADDSVIAEVPACGELETLQAITAAEDAHADFAAWPVRNRVELQWPGGPQGTTGIADHSGGREASS